MINAASSAMDFETVRIDRDFTNNSNRLLNLDTANISKSMSTASRQINEIEFLESRSLLIGLNKKVLLIAKIISFFLLIIGYIKFKAVVLPYSYLRSHSYYEYHST